VNRKPHKTQSWTHFPHSKKLQMKNQNFSKLPNYIQKWKILIDKISTPLANFRVKIEKFELAFRS